MFSMYGLPFIVFCLSVMGIIINRTNIMLILMCMEIMLLSISLNFLMHSFSLNAVLGHVSIYVMTVAAVESVMDLSMMSFYKMKGSMSMSFLNLLTG